LAPSDLDTVADDGEGLVDWFEMLTEFPEVGYDETRTKLAVDSNRLRSLVNG
jgi:hypothetical protein